MFKANTTAVKGALRLQTPDISRVVAWRRPLSTFTDGECYWKDTPWKDVPVDEFNSYRWQVRNTVNDKRTLQRFLSEALPERLGLSKNDLLQHIRHKQDFINDAVAATKLAPMAIRLTPHVLSRVDWSNPLDDPIRKQFLPLASGIIPDNKHLELDSLHEEADSPVPGLVHRYPGRALFLATSICPVYCRFCTRSYAVGASTETVKKKPQKPSRKRWETVFQHIESDQSLQDIVVSGGDAYYLQPEDLLEIGFRLLGMDHLRRIRFASKGLAVAPCRIQKGDPWTEALITLSKAGRQSGKQVCLHTHINHAREITWVTKKAANYLFEHGVIVRNQSVLLNGVNNTYEEMSELIKTLSDINIQPYYVYQCDMVQGVEDLRTPLKEIIDLDKKIRGTLSGFMMPSFVIDLPGGGGKRLVSTCEEYEEGIARYRAPGLDGEKGKMNYFYHDPKPVVATEVAALRRQKAEALERGQTLAHVPRSWQDAREAPLAIDDTSAIPSTSRVYLVAV
ncbi:kama family protein [Setomelanomma holmii]|uniref:Kama family protein n=1 Tax=Setomelanomma holmii TaxID=210430 RepID=A0A9P4HJ62_9PLEO|nr:kama family protein [Setomelanomma holmii]